MPDFSPKDSASMEPTPAAADGQKPAPPVPATNLFVKRPHKSEHDPADYLGCLEDAERLLKYAAESGLSVDDATRSGVLNARAIETSKWNEQIVADLLVALTKLTTQLKPVTAESLRTFNTTPTVRRYWVVAIILAALIVPYSVASFVSSSISQKIQSDITTANGLAVKLDAQIVSSPSASPAPGSTIKAAGNAYSLAQGASPIDVLTSLQALASTTRAIYSRGYQLNHFVLNRVYDPYANGERTTYRNSFELPVPLSLLPKDLAGQAAIQIPFYQDVRFYGQGVVDDVSVFYGAVATCVLPVLYALLGTSAFLLRSFSQHMSTRTFVPSRCDSPRFLIAAIGGAVVGFFNRFTTGGDASVSPLAIAFLVGYAVDVFFSFLDGLVQNFGNKAAMPHN